ncbi:hypothetical protein QTP99_11670 [Caldanaerobacter subterraneus KAk]|uniref:hypothetical protein n=1 Tax=Caldanaerobacter subterraneus TaxID=911092 RepID=UPI0032C07C7C
MGKKKMLLWSLFIILIFSIIFFVEYSFFLKQDKEEVMLIPDDSGKVEFNAGYLELSYDFSQVKILKKDDKIEVIDKLTGELLDVYGEEVKPLSEGKYQYTIYREREGDFGILRLYTVFEVFEKEGRREIVRILNKYWDIISKKGWYVENQHVVSLLEPEDLPSKIITTGMVTISKKDKKKMDIIRRRYDTGYTYSLD